MNIVLKDFKCKVTKKIHQAGKEYVGDRLEELQELGYVSKSDSNPVQLPNDKKAKVKKADAAAQEELNK